MPLDPCSKLWGRSATDHLHFFQLRLVTWSRGKLVGDIDVVQGTRIDLLDVVDHWRDYQEHPEFASEYDEQVSVGMAVLYFPAIGHRIIGVSGFV